MDKRGERNNENTEKRERIGKNEIDREKQVKKTSKWVEEGGTQRNVKKMDMTGWRKKKNTNDGGNKRERMKEGKIIGEKKEKWRKKR